MSKNTHNMACPSAEHSELRPNGTNTWQMPSPLESEDLPAMKMDAASLLASSAEWGVRPLLPVPAGSAGDEDD
jgi:hypothetical protein